MKKYTKTKETHQPMAGKTPHEILLWKNKIRHTLMCNAHSEFLDFEWSDTDVSIQNVFFNKHRQVKDGMDIKRKYKWVEDNKERRVEQTRRSHLKCKFGITPKYYEDMLKRQGGRCAICGSQDNNIRTRGKKNHNLYVDHCHTTGSVRGLLCYKCNTGIGHLQDDPELCREAAKYLENIDDALKAFNQK